MSYSSKSSYQFTIQGGTVTAVYEIENGRIKQESIDRDETWTVQGRQVLRSEIDDGRIETTVYDDTDGDGIYLEIDSDSDDDDSLDNDQGDDRDGDLWIAGSSDDDDYLVSQTLQLIESGEDFSDIDVEGGRELESGSDGDDHVGLTDGGYAYGGRGADMFVFRELGRLRIDDFNPEEGDLIVFDTGLGLDSLEQVVAYVSTVSYDGRDTCVKFGEQVSLTLVGVCPDDIPAAVVVLS